MTVEQFPLNKNKEQTEFLNIDKDAGRIIHFSNGKPFQALSLLKEEAYRFTYLTYDRFVDGLWTRLVIHPSSPTSALKHFSLGRVRDTGDYHGVLFSKGDNILKHYYASEEKKYVTRSLRSLPKIDWENFRRSKKIEYARAVKGTCSDPSTGKFSFAFELIPAPYGPIAQVSLTEDFKVEKTLLVDTSLELTARSIDYIIGEARILFGKDKILERKAPQFCDELQMLFANFFPIDLKNR